MATTGRRSTRSNGKKSAASDPPPIEDPIIEEPVAKKANRIGKAQSPAASKGSQRGRHEGKGEPGQGNQPEGEEPLVEVDEGDEEGEDDLDLLAAAPPDFDEEGQIVDVNVDVDGDIDADHALVKRAAIALPEGEWVKGEGEAVVDTTRSRSGDDLYDRFVREATKLQRLSEEEERALGLRVRDREDKAAAKKLVVHNLRLAIKMAHQYRRSWTNLMDLVQEASAGMAIAAQRWDPDQGTRFGTYAVYWIRAQLTKFLMTHGRAIHTGNTRAGRKLYFQLPRVRRKLLAEGKEPSIENIAQEVQEDPIEVARIVARLDGREASIDAQVGDEEGATLGDMLAHDDGGPEENAGRIEVQQLINGVMGRFEQTLDNERDRAIWREHLVAQEPRSLVELGARYGVSKQRMGQLATRIKRAFRRHVIDELGPETQLSWLFSQE